MFTLIVFLQGGNTALMWASASYHTDTVLPCVYSPQYGGTALMLASYHGRTDTVRALLSAGAQADLQDEVSIVFVSYHRKIHPSRIC